MPLDNPVDLDSDDENELQEACKRQWVDDVEAAFKSLPEKGAKLAMLTAGHFVNNLRYTRRKKNDKGYQNHFQGCVRLLEGPHLAITGGDWHQPASHLYVAKLQSRGQKKTWGSNLTDGDVPAATEKIVAHTDLDGKRWHAGGIDICGHILAVPTECGKKFKGTTAPPCKPDLSRILFFDMRTPGKPAVLKPRIDRTGSKATAVALVCVPNMGYIAAVLSADKGDKQHRDARIDFYQTAGGTFSSGFVSTPSSCRIPKALEWKSYQTINFVYQSDQELFLVATTDNVADLFTVSYPGVGSPPSMVLDLQWKARKKFDLDSKYAEFVAGASVYAADNKLRLYAVPRWRLGDGRLRAMEFAP